MIPREAPHSTGACMIVLAADETCSGPSALVILGDECLHLHSQIVAGGHQLYAAAQELTYSVPRMRAVHC